MMTNKPLFMLFDGKFNEDFCLQSFYTSGQPQRAIKAVNVVDFTSGHYLVHVDAVLATLHAKSNSVDVENAVWNLQDGESCVLYSTSRHTNLIAYRLSEQDIEFLQSVS